LLVGGNAANNYPPPPNNWQGVLVNLTDKRATRKLNLAARLFVTAKIVYF
jgi:hypothetical protein